MSRLKNKVAIVAGAGTGIGEAVAKKFASEGAKVVVCSLPGDPVEDVVKSIEDDGGQAVGYAGDISEVSEAQACVQKALDEFGKLDVLVVTAGVYQEMNMTEDFTIEGFDYMVKMNVRSAFLMAKYALPHIQKTKGNLIFTGSEAGTLGQPECTPYGGTKGFHIALARGIAGEQAKHGVRANVVCPGPTWTSWHKPEGPTGMTKEMEEQIQSAVPLGRHGSTEEVANVYCFLASDEASFVTGSLYFADGGITIGRGNVGEQVPDELRQRPKGNLDIDHATTPSQGNIQAARA
ncbi:SDR family oxidoreductase [Phototrophicus methaneseepsis]|uniref:SDR family oxidoreductase n=1 Tax=Phototrophicus methaneseepsis TaxID=2710758 RepID=A0A7S8ICG4_9CHLR|nr:SDR family oxidoreductase [Phototrophicus methaneseepsis]QPC80502.1 SDR family oxidoreductase [Phototrophicus methaneseepsis]